MSEATPAYLDDLYSPVFAEEWDRVLLHDLADWINGLAFKTIDFSDQGVPVIKIAEVKNGITGQTKFTAATYDAKFRLSDGDMLFCWSGQPETSIDTYRWSRGDGWLNQHVFKVLPHDEVEADYFYYLMRYLRPSFVRIARNKQTTGLGHVTKGDLKRMRVALPPRVVQRRTAARLGLIDRLIDSRTRAIHLAESLLDELADQASGNVNKIPLGNLVDATRSTVNPATFGDSTVDHFSLPAFDVGAVPERVAASSIRSNKILLAGPTILVSRLNPRINRIWLASPSTGVPALASTEFSALTTNGEMSLASLWLAVRSPNFLRELPQRVTGTSGSHQRVRPDDLLAIEVPDTRQLSRGTESRADRLLQGLGQWRREVVSLVAYRDLVMPELISGRIRVGEVAA